MSSERKIILNIFGYGILTWLIPFLISIPFYSPRGDLLINPDLFKSIMILTGCIVGAVLIIRLFSGICSGYVRYGMMAGLSWLCINWILDGIILIPMSGMDLGSYTAQIGLRYLMIPVMTIMAGYAASGAAVQKTGL